MSFDVRFLSEAFDDVLEAQSWYENRREGLGEEFLLSLDSCLKDLQNSPESYPTISKKIRRAVLRRFPYCVYFAVHDDDLVILAVLHGGRSARVWKNRKLQ